MRQTVKQYLQLDETDVQLLLPILMSVKVVNMLEFQYWPVHKKIDLLAQLLEGRVHIDFSRFYIVEQSAAMRDKLQSVKNAFVELLQNLKKPLRLGVTKTKEIVNKLVQTTMEANKVKETVPGFVTSASKKVWEKLLDVSNKIDEQAKNKPFYSGLRNIVMLYYNAVIKRFGEGTLSSAAILIGTVVGVLLLLLYLLGKTPVVGKLFAFLFKVLSAPFRILWRALGFVLRKLKLI